MAVPNVCINDSAVLRFIPDVSTDCTSYPRDSHRLLFSRISSLVLLYVKKCVNFFLAATATFRQAFQGSNLPIVITYAKAKVLQLNQKNYHTHGNHPHRTWPLKRDYGSVKSLQWQSGNRAMRLGHQILTGKMGYLEDCLPKACPTGFMISGF